MGQNGEEDNYLEFAQNIQLSERMNQEMKVLHSNENYRLKGNLTGDVICLDLCQLHRGFIQKSYSTEVCFSQLPYSMKKNFSNPQNLLSFVSEPSFCKIDTQKGVINLCSTLTLPNGTSIELPTGEIKLSEYSKGKNQELYNLIPLVFSEHELPNHQIKAALQLLCKTIADLTEKISEFQSFHPTAPHSPKPQKKPSKSNKQIDSIKIPVLGNNFRNSTSGTEACNTLNSSDEEEKYSSVDFDSVMMRTSNPQFNIEEKIKHHKKQVEYLQSQFQENKNMMMRKISKLERKNVEVQKNLTKIFKELEEQKSTKSRVRPRKLSSDYIENSQENSDQILPATLAQKKKPIRSSNDGTGSISSNMMSPNSNFPRNYSFEDDSSFLQEPTLQNVCKSDVIDTTCSFIRHFNIEGPVATYSGEDWTKTQLLGKVSIKEQPRFSVKIRKTKRRYLWIGVADSSYKSRRWSWGLQNWIYYCGWNGKVYEGPDRNIKAEGSGYRQGQILDIDVNVGEGEIIWRVDGEVRARHFSEKLKDLSIKWVPLIKFFDNGDCVEWI